MADCPPLADRIGDDIVTASGTTLLGADNKAGVAEIVTAAEYLVAHPEIPHGPIRIAFTPDEEVGRGTQFFDVAAFGAAYAYTMDGSTRGELEIESFSADAMTVTLRRLQHASRLRQGADGQLDQGRGRFHPAAAARACHRRRRTGTRGSSIRTCCRAAARRRPSGFIIRDFKTGGAEGEGADARAAGARDGAAARREASRSRSKSSTATCARCSTTIRTSSSTRARRSAAPA